MIGVKAITMSISGNFGAHPYASSGSHFIEQYGGRPKTLVYILYKAETCEKQNQCFSVVAKGPRKHGERAGERVI